MKIVIIGSGPGAQALASMNAERSEPCKVVLLESSKGKINNKTQVKWPGGQTSSLNNCIITNNAQEAIQDAEIILFCNPANSYPALLKEIANYVTASTKLICGVPGASGFDWMVRDAFAGKTMAFTIAAVESLPFIAKRKSDTNDIIVHAFKHQLYLASTPLISEESALFKTLENIFSVVLKPLNLFLSLTLINPNAKVHPLLFLEALESQKIHGKMAYHSYQLNDKHAALLGRIENEINELSKCITFKTGLVIDELPDVRKWFADCYPVIIKDKSTAQSCLATHEVYTALQDDFLKGIEDPNTADKEKSRFLSEEIPYGLLSFKGLAELLGQSTLTLESVIERCQRYLGKEYIKDGKLLLHSSHDTSAPQRFGMNVLSKLNRYYQAQSNDRKLEIEEFQENGIVFFGKLLPAEKSLEIQQTVSEKITNVQAVDTEKLLLNLHWKDKRIANFCSLPEFVSAACDLLKVKEVRVFSSLIVFKKPNEKMPVPWHQDPAYQWPLDPIDCASLWFALDDVTPQNGAMDVALGGHKVGVFPMRPTPKQHDDEYHFSPQLAQSISEKELEKFPILKCDMLQYEASFHHSMMPHSSPLNLTQNRRCAFIVRYCKGNAKINLYKGMPREAFFRGYKLFNPHLAA